MADTGSPDTARGTVRAVELDTRSVAWVLGAFVSLLALTALVRSASRALTILAVATLLALALSPVVARTEKLLRGSRTGAVAIVILGLVLVATLAGLLLVPRAVQQGQRLSNDLDRVVRQINDLPVVGPDLRKAHTADKLRSWIEDLPGRLEGRNSPLKDLARRLADAVVVAFLTVLVTITLLLDGERLLRGARRLVPSHRRGQADRLARLTYETIGRYVAGSILVAVIAGVATLVAGLVLHVPLAPLLAVWVALFDLVPQIGGAAGGVPFVLLGLTRGAGTGVACLGFFILYLQFENHVLGPVIVGRSVKLSPPATMTAALVGVSAAGVVGALLAVPVLAAGKLIYLEFRPPSPEPDAEADAPDRDDAETSDRR